MCDNRRMTMQTATERSRFTFDLADRMRKTLRESGASVQDMADYLGVTRGTVSTWINGRIEPSRQTLRLWAMATGFPVSWLETGEAPPDDWEPPTRLHEWAPWGSNPRPADYKSGALTRNRITFLPIGVAA